MTWPGRRGYEPPGRLSLFRPDPTIPFLEATPEAVVLLVESLNQPQISIPSKAPQSAHGYLCGLRRAVGRFSLYVGLWLPDSAENVIYAHDPLEFEAGELGAVAAEGTHFLESMGFMLDDLRFRQLGPEQQRATLARLPLFTPPRPAPRPRDDAAERQAAVARLLSSF